jgi:dienelactone hydrolase
MKCRWIAAGIAILFLLPFTVTAQDSMTKHIAARGELHSIKSLTISDGQFLKGDNNGKPEVVSGYLRIAQGSGRLPVVVLLHGSSGMGPNTDVWTKEFNEMGISTFALDCFTGRGLTVVGTDQALLGRLNMILDAYRALEILVRHPRVDPTRIVLMGFSRGGQATLYASLKRFNQTWNKSGIEYAAYIPFYPDCTNTYRSDTELVGRPVRIFHGALDDYAPATPCEAYVARLKSAGNDVQLTKYPKGQHAFDNPLAGLTPTVMKNAQTVRRCVIREEPLGELTNAATGQPFSYKDACVERNPHVEYDPAATQAAKQSVKDFLKEVLKLN